MSAILEKLKMVKEAERKAQQILELYRQMADEALSLAQEEVLRQKELEEAAAREEGKSEMEEMIELSMREAEELRVEYMFDRAKLLSEVAERHREAVAFLMEKLEKGE